MRKIKYILLTIIIGAFLLVMITPTKASVTLTPLYRNGVLIKHRGTDNPVMTPTTFVEKEEEFRGVWIPTVWNLAFPRHTSEAQYKAAFQELITRVKSKNLNAILFQTRPMNDAFYASAYAPYSRYFVGPEGTAPGWDAMAWMVEYAHAQGVQFHAWLNPYRVANSPLSKQDYLNTLHPDNFARKNPSYVIAGTKSGDNYPYILDPGRPQVKTYINNVVKELIEKYNIDGIHFDDYFYPYSGTPTAADDATYAANNPGGLSRNDWRRKNVDDAVSGVKAIIDTHNVNNGKKVKFGISPFGIWRNKGTDPLGSNTAGLQSYDAQYADSRKWIKNNWVHYITPQIYWTFNTQPAAPYADVVDWWAETVRGTNVDLIVGHSITSDTLLDDEMMAQTNYNRKHPEIKGSILYSAGLPGGDKDYLNRPIINNLVSQHWKTSVPNVYETAVEDSFKTKLDNYYATTLAKPNYSTINNINLINTLGGHQITWTSNNTSVISNLGVVTRPAHDQADATVSLTAKNQLNETVTYTVIVPKQEPPVVVEPPQPPTVTIEGELVDDAYIEAITITLNAEPGTRIEYLYTDGVYTLPQTVYTEPIVFNRRTGGYVFTAFAYDSDNKKSEALRFNVRMNIPYDETYTEVIRNGNPVKYQETGRNVTLPAYREKTNEVRAVWVATVSNIDVPLYQNDDQYKAYLIDILDTVQALNMNTIFFQVRSMNDAFYPSVHAPYSKYIKGLPGEGLDWDILEFMVEEAHQRGIELHAWINPYRVMNKAAGTKEAKLNSLHEDNWARKNPDLVMEDNEGALILNPGEPQVRQYISNVIQELMENYQIDGVHMDDYFYTYGGHKPEHDATAFSKYNPDNLSLADWRRTNIDKLVEQIWYQVEGFNETNNRNIKWGISPIGIWRSIEDDPNGSYTGKNSASSYRDQYADTRKWVKEGWLHYINPQVYWEFSREVAPYADIVKWWNDQAEGTNVKVLVGQGFYRMIENNTSMNDENEMIDQIRLNQRFRNVIGTVFFSYRTLKSPHRVVNSTLKRLKDSFWTKPVQWAWPTDVKDPKILELSDLLTNFKDYYGRITATDLSPALLEPGLYANWAIMSESNKFIRDVEAFLNQITIEPSELQTWIDNLNDLNIRLREQAFLVTEDSSLEAAQEEALAKLLALEERIKLINKTTQQDPKKLPKGEQYILVSSLNNINRSIREFKEDIENATTIEEIESKLSEIENYETNLEEYIIVGEQAKSLDDLTIYLIVGGVSLLMIIGLAVLVIKRKK